MFYICAIIAYHVLWIKQCFIISCFKGCINQRLVSISLPIACSAPLNGQVDCGNGLVNMGVEGDNCTFSCDPGYMLQGSVTSGVCDNTETWSGGLPSCVPVNCSEYGLPVPANAIVLQLPSCGLAYQSQCTVSCDEGFAGDDITYLCNITSDHDPIMVDWVPIGGVDVMCERGLL